MVYFWKQLNCSIPPVLLLILFSWPLCPVVEAQGMIPVKKDRHRQERFPCRSINWWRSSTHQQPRIIAYLKNVIPHWEEVWK